MSYKITGYVIKIGGMESERTIDHKPASYSKRTCRQQLAVDQSYSDKAMLHSKNGAFIFGQIKEASFFILTPEACIFIIIVLYYLSLTGSRAAYSLCLLFAWQYKYFSHRK